MPIFKVPCPSCEAQVLIKNPNLIGTKVECPKCKYRFKVEEPKEGPAGAGDKKDAGKKDAADKKKKKGINPKVLAGVGLAIVGVVLVAIGIAVFGGGKKPSGNVGGGTPVVPQPPPPDEKDPKDTPQNKLRTIENSLPEGVKGVTNLLHPNAETVYRFNWDRIRDSALGPQLFDANMAKLFRSSMGFDATDVVSYLHCGVGPDRLPFGVIQLKPAARKPPREIAAKMRLTQPHATFGERELYRTESNPFLNAVTTTATMRTMLADYLTPAPPTTAPAGNKPHGVCVYDTQTIIFGDFTVMEDYMRGLNADGFPEFRNKPSASGEAAKDISQLAIYQTLDPDLRRAMLAMEAIEGQRPLVVWAEKFDPKRYDPKLLKDDFKPVGEEIRPVTARLKHYGVRVSEFDRQKLTAAVRLFMSEADADVVVNELSPKLALATPLISLALSPSPLKDDTPIVFRDFTKGDPTGGVGEITPGGPGVIPGPGVPPGPGIGRPTRGGGGEGEGRPMPGFSPMPGTPGFQPLPGQENPSYIDLRQLEGVVEISVAISWKEEVFNQIVYPWLRRETEQLKGKLEVHSGLSDPHTVAAAAKAVQKLPAPTNRKEDNRFPVGTVDRVADSRLSVPAPPETRLSLYVDLLPYLGRDPRVGDRREAWFHPKNLPGAEQWVPELVVPYYPESSWRVSSPFAPGRTLGGTNYVTIAGVGIDAARYNPDDPKHKKLMGMTGYEWNSTPAEVEDGLSNTIYQMQVKPGIGRPWMAGGGATVVGINDQKGRHPMDDFAYKHPGQAKPGSHAIMGDGSVRYIPADIDPDVFKALVTRAGGETIPGEKLNTAPLIEPPAPPVPTMPPTMTETPSPKKETPPKDKDMMGGATDPAAVQKKDQ